MTNILNSLMSGGYEPDIDIDIDSNWVPDIDCRYVVYYQEEGNTYYFTFTVFEGEDETFVFKQACEFAKNHDSLVFYREPDFTYFNPKTGKEVHTPHCGSGIDFYLLQEYSPSTCAGFTAIETDELPL